MATIKVVELIDCMSQYEWLQIEEAESDEIYFQGMTMHVPQELWDKKIVWILNDIDCIRLLVE